MFHKFKESSIGKACLRVLLSIASLYVLSNLLLLPSAVLASEPIEHRTRLALFTMTQDTSMSLPSQIFKRWTHSREEDQGDILVYHPTDSDYPFPPARGREGLEFRENGEFIRYPIGAADKSLGVPGRWNAQNQNAVEVQFPDQSASAYNLTILECDEQVLKIKRTAEGIAP